MFCGYSRFGPNPRLPHRERRPRPVSHVTALRLTAELYWRTSQSGGVAMTATAAAQRADAWSVCETDFPARASLAEQFAFLLNYAVLAPSSHNTQPWCFS